RYLAVEHIYQRLHNKPVTLFNILNRLKIILVVFFQYLYSVIQLYRWRNPLLNHRSRTTDNRDTSTHGKNCLYRLHYVHIISPSNILVSHSHYSTNHSNIRPARKPHDRQSPVCMCLSGCPRRNPGQCKYPARDLLPEAGEIRFDGGMRPKHNLQRAYLTDKTPSWTVRHKLSPSPDP